MVQGEIKLEEIVLIATEMICLLENVFTTMPNTHHKRPRNYFLVKQIVAFSFRNKKMIDLVTKHQYNLI